MVAKAVGEKFDQAAGEAIDNTIEDIGEKVTEEVCGLIKKGNDKIGGKNGVAGAYTLGGTSLAAAMVLAFA